MTISRFLKISAAFLGLAMETVSFACPDYATEETRQVIEAMVEAHGGLDRWRDAPAIRFDNVMHNNFHQENEFAWWVAHEVIEQGGRRAWQAWPMDDARIGFDGDKVWSVNWQRGNPSAHMVHFFYYFVNLPWLTQDDGVNLSSVTRFKWPGTEKSLYEIRMTFDKAPGIGKSGNDYYVLYIDPDTHRLVGYQYAAGYRPLLEVMNLPEDREVFGPMWRTITRYEEVDGLLFPAAFRTSPEPGGRIAGNHVILNIDISSPFEEARAEQPANAVLFAGPLMTD